MAFNYAKLTAPTKRIYDTCQGYRDEECYGSNECIFASVLNYETGVLKNRDIYHTLRNVYGWKANLRQSTDILNREVLRTVAQYMQCSMWDLRCVWVCDSIERVCSNYGNADLRLVKFDKNMLIASDLGNEGALIVCKEFFKYNI